ncbi:MAG TPA: response regulator [Candidatus Xenobia bacterium]
MDRDRREEVVGGDTLVNIGGIRILLVEDNPINQQVAQELLESAGGQVTLAEHGGEAVQVLVHGPQPPPFELVLMDVDMPEMDGLTATRLLRAVPGLAALPIVAMTANALPEERQCCLDAGMTDYLSKFVDPDQLFATVLRWATSVEKTPGAPQLPGLDVPSALRRVGGNDRLYRKLLGEFADGFADGHQQIAQALSAGDRARAERVAHTIKGVAGNLGLTSTQDLAEEVEQTLHQGGQPELAPLGADLGRCVAAIHQSRAMADPTPAPQVAFDQAAAAQAATALRAMLENFDASAAEGCATLVEATAGRIDTTALEKAVNDFDFATALQRLEEVSRQLQAKRTLEAGGLTQ